MLRFFKGVQGMSVWDHEREGDALVDFNLGVEQAYGFGFGKAEAVEDFDGPLFQAGVDTSVNAVGHMHSFSHAAIVRHLSCKEKIFYISAAAGEEDEFVGIGRRDQLSYSNVWSLLNVSMIAFGDAAPFFTAWRIFQSKLLI